MNEISFLFDRILERGVLLWLKQLHVDFPKSVEQKKAHLGFLVENEGKQFLDVLQEEIDTAYNECERVYLVHNALNVLEEKLERTAVLINYQWIEDQGLHSYPAHSYSCVASQASMADLIYVLQLVKRELIHLYLEVQDLYKKYHKRNNLTLKDICWVYFKEVVQAEVSFVGANRFRVDRKRVGNMMVNELSCYGMSGVGMSYGDMGSEELTYDELSGDRKSIGSKNVWRKRVGEPVVRYEGKGRQKADENIFEPQMSDISPADKEVLAYDDIVENKRKFARLEVELFDNELLDTNYRFKRKPHGNVMKMAAVYWVAFQKGYFKKLYFKNKRKREVTANDVRLFLNHRYQTYIERQFQNFRDEKVLESYLDREFSISLMVR